VLLLAAACTHAPPTLSPQGVHDFNTLRVIKALDLLRDTAIDANKQTPPLLTTATTRKIVNYHKFAVMTLDASGAGAKAGVSSALAQLIADPSLTPPELALVQPYYALVKTAIDNL
jgi:hypothetical protein